MTEHTLLPVDEVGDLPDIDGLDAKLGEARNRRAAIACSLYHERVGPASGNADEALLRIRDALSVSTLEERSGSTLPTPL